jgi:ion channel-forming bestrophin family protein
VADIYSVLLTVLGFVVGLALSFRSSTAYERYAEGRRYLPSKTLLTVIRYWATLVLTARNLARVVWVHAAERDGEHNKQDLVSKLYVP